MKELTAREVYDVLSNSTAVIIDDDALVYPSLDDLTGDPDNVFVCFSWLDEEGNEYNFAVIEGTSHYMDEDGNLILLDEVGDKVKITPLFKMNDCLSNKK